MRAVFGSDIVSTRSRRLIADVVALQAGPAKTLKIDKYRCAPLSFSSSDLKF